MTTVGKKLSKMPKGDLAIRFAFGAFVSIVSGALSIGFGAKLGGVFLAFPAILPATLTLIQKEQSKKEAEEDDQGAKLGSLGLLSFAVVAAVLLEHHSAWLALSAASAAWLAVSLLLYLWLYRARSRSSA